MDESSLKIEKVRALICYCCDLIYSVFCFAVDLTAALRGPEASCQTLLADIKPLFYPVLSSISLLYQIFHCPVSILSVL